MKSIATIEHLKIRGDLNSCTFKYKFYMTSEKYLYELRQFFTSKFHKGQTKSLP